MNAILGLSDEELHQLGQRGFALAFRLLRHREDAADVVQDALHQLFRSQQTYEPAGGAVSAWFLKIVRNRAIDIQRKRRPRLAGQDFNPAMTESADPIVQSETQKRVRESLAALDEPTREILLLRDFHDLSYAEISEVLGIPSGTVMSRLHRARTKLRERFLLLESGGKSC